MNPGSTRQSSTIARADAQPPAGFESFAESDVLRSGQPVRTSGIDFAGQLPGSELSWSRPPSTDRRRSSGSVSRRRTHSRRQQFDETRPPRSRGATQNYGARTIAGAGHTKCLGRPLAARARRVASPYRVICSHRNVRSVAYLVRTTFVPHSLSGPEEHTVCPRSPTHLAEVRKTTRRATLARADLARIHLVAHALLSASANGHSRFGWSCRHQAVRCRVARDGHPADHLRGGHLFTRRGSVPGGDSGARPGSLVPRGLRRTRSRDS